LSWRHSYTYTSLKHDIVVEGFIPLPLARASLALTSPSTRFAALKSLKHDIVVEGYTPTVEYWWEPYNNDRSLCTYPRDHPTREMCIKIAESQAFDNFILFCIALSTVLMAVDSPVVYASDSNEHILFGVVDMVVNVIFTFEVAIRVVAMNFWFHPQAYLQDGWCQLDFGIVLMSWLALIDGMPNLKPFRAFRGLKALKAVKFLTYCGAVMDALTAAIPMLFDVMCVTIFLMTVFGIMGVQALKCRLKYRCSTGTTRADPMMQPETGCYTLNPPINSCPMGFNCVSYSNPGDGFADFDDIFMALFTLFQVLTFEGWTPLM